MNSKPGKGEATKAGFEGPRKIRILDDAGPVNSSGSITCRGWKTVGLFADRG